MSERTVHCTKLDKDLPGLTSPPFAGELGNEIFNKVSLEAWKMWQDDLMIKIINEYRLNLAEEEHYKVLLDQMRAFFNLSGSGEQVLEVENEKRGRS